MLYSQVSDRKQLPLTNEARLCDSYHRWFDVISANTRELQEQAYRLRYQVYCREHQYETPDEHPLQMETDEYDSRSIHSLVTDKASEEPMGTVRLILPDSHSPEESFPIQQFCKHPLPAPILMSSAAEISRFAVSKKMREMAGTNYPKEFKCSIALGLMRAIVQMSMDQGITDWFAIMEPPLLRLLCRFGIYFTPVGPLVEYHGMRQPCHANADTLLGRVRNEHQDLWEFLTVPGYPMRENAIAANF